MRGYLQKMVPPLPLFPLAFHRRTCSPYRSSMSMWVYTLQSKNKSVGYQKRYIVLDDASLSYYRSSSVRGPRPPLSNTKVSHAASGRIRRLPVQSLCAPSCRCFGRNRGALLLCSHSRALDLSGCDICHCSVDTSADPNGTASASMPDIARFCSAAATSSRP